MAKEDKEKEVSDTIMLEIPQEYTVKRSFTLDKKYYPKDKVLLKEGKLKETLISNNFI